MEPLPASLQSSPVITKPAPTLARAASTCTLSRTQSSLNAMFRASDLGGDLGSMSPLLTSHRTSFLDLPREIRFKIYRLTLDLDPSNPSPVTLRSRCKRARDVHQPFTLLLPGFPSQSALRRLLASLIGTTTDTPHHPDSAFLPATPPLLTCSAPPPYLQPGGGWFDTTSLLRISRAIHDEFADLLYASRIFKLHACHYTTSVEGSLLCATHLPVGRRNLSLIRSLTLCWDSSLYARTASGKANLRWVLQTLLPAMTALRKFAVHVSGLVLTHYDAPAVRLGSKDTPSGRMLLEALWGMKHVHKEFLVLLCGRMCGKEGLGKMQDGIVAMEHEKGEKPPFRVATCSVQYSRENVQGDSTPPPSFPMDGACYRAHCGVKDHSQSWGDYGL